MNRMPTRRLLAASLAPIAFVLCASVAAQNAASVPGAKSLEQTRRPVTVPDARASKLMGRQVKSLQGDDLGKIEDLVINIDTEKVVYAVLSSGGVLGIGDKLFAFPVNLFQQGRNANELALNIDKERLKKAPNFERDRRPNWANNSYRNEVDRFFFKEDTGRRSGSSRLMSATELIGKDVNDRGAHDAGEIEDLIVNFGTGRTYVILDFDKSWSPDDKLLALPLSAFTFPSRPDLDIVLNLQRDKIDMARGFDENRWPNLNDANYQRDLSTYLSNIQLESNNTGRSSGASR